MNKTRTSISLDVDVMEWLDREAAKRNLNRSELIEAICRGIIRRGRPDEMADLITLSGRVRDIDTLAAALERTVDRIIHEYGGEVFHGHVGWSGDVPDRRIELVIREETGRKSKWFLDQLLEGG